MSIRLILAIALALAVPMAAHAQVATVDPAPAVAPVAAQAAVTPQPAVAPQPVQPPVPAATPRSRNERSRESARDIEERLEAMKQRRLQNDQERQSKGVNVRIDATVIESRGDQVTGRKVLSLTLVDGGEWGSVRSTQQVAFRPGGSTFPVRNYSAAPLNMDARAFLRDDGRIRVSLTLEYRGAAVASRGAATETGDEGAIDEGIKQNVTVVLEPGKPLVVAQSADAVGDRRVALEVKATVLK